MYFIFLYTVYTPLTTKYHVIQLSKVRDTVLYILNDTAIHGGKKKSIVRTYSPGKTTILIVSCLSTGFTYSMSFFFVFFFVNHLIHNVFKIKIKKNVLHKIKHK